MNGRCSKSGPQAGTPLGGKNLCLDDKIHLDYICGNLDFPPGEDQCHWEGGANEGVLDLQRSFGAWLRFLASTWMS